MGSLDKILVKYMRKSISIYIIFCKEIYIIYIQIGFILLRSYIARHFLGAGAPLGLANLVTVHQKVSKSNNLFSLVSTSILILVTCYIFLCPDTYYLLLVTLHLLQVHVTWYFHLLFVTLFLLNLIHLILLPSTCFLIIFT